MLKLILLTVLAVTLLEVVNAKEDEVRYIHSITEGLYQNYSGRALVNLGSRWYFFENTIKSTWHEASNFCRNLGMFLVSVETKEENDLIKDHITNVAGIANYWMSGNDLATVGQWVWDSTGQKVTFTDWALGQPNWLGLERYMHYYYNNLKWNNELDVNWADGQNMYTICEQG